MDPIKPDDNSQMFDRMFRDGLRDHEVAPGEGMWDRIEQGMGQAAVAESTGNNRYWYYVAAFLLIPVVISSLLLNTDMSTYLADQNEPVNTSNTQYFISPLIGVLPQNIEHTGFEYLLNSNAYTNATNSTGDNFIAAIGGNDRSGVDGFSANGSNSFNASVAAIGGNGGGDDKGNRKNKKNKKAGNNANATYTTGEQSDLNYEQRIALDKKAISLPQNDVDVYGQSDEEIDVASVFKKEKANLKNRHINDVQGITIGGFYGMHVNGMLFKDGTFDNLVGKDYKRSVNSGMSYGMSIGYDFSPKFGLYTEAVFRSEQSFSYHELRGGKLRIDGQMDLTYMHFPLLLKTKWTRISKVTNEPMAFNLVTGIQYSRLRSASAIMNENSVKQMENYFSKNQMGLVLGFEYDFYLHESYYLTLGARASMSTDLNLKEMYGIGNNPEMPGEQSRIYNYVIGVNARLNYHIKTKRK